MMIALANLANKPGYKQKRHRRPSLICHFPPGRGIK